MYSFWELYSEGDLIYGTARFKFDAHAYCIHEQMYTYSMHTTMNIRFYVNLHANKNPSGVTHERTVHMVGYLLHSLKGQFACTGHILFKYLLYIHEFGCTIGTHALTQNVPASIFQARSFACTRRAKRD